MGNFRLKNFKGLSGRRGQEPPRGIATKSPASAPITQRSKSPLKMNTTLVAGAKALAESKNADLASGLDFDSYLRPPTNTGQPATPAGGKKEETPSPGGKKEETPSVDDKIEIEELPEMEEISEEDDEIELL